VRLALVVTLPPEFHVQSNAPRDQTLIPTVLTIEPPAGAEVVEIVYPDPVDFKMVDVEEPLAVFPHEFALGAEIALPLAATPGPLQVPGVLRYQACNDTVCFPPARATAAWTLRITR
jgi:hypothetical protein